MEPRAGVGEVGSVSGRRRSADTVLGVVHRKLSSSLASSVSASGWLSGPDLFKRAPRLLRSAPRVV